MKYPGWNEVQEANDEPAYGYCVQCGTEHSFAKGCPYPPKPTIDLGDSVRVHGEDTPFRVTATGGPCVVHGCQILISGGRKVCESQVDLVAKMPPDGGR